MNRQQSNKSYYQKNQARLKLKRREKYQQSKNQTQLDTSKYYGAEAIKILISLKEYTELNAQKHKLWLNFIWTFKALNKAGFYEIIQVMKIREEAENLINDYWTTAKSEKKSRSRSWNSLDYDEQQRLIKYWAREKTRIENNYLTELEQQEIASQEYLKAIELAKFHEERGKYKCSCYDCETKQEIRKESKGKIEKESNKEQCSKCNRWVKWLDEENDLCKRCIEQYE